MIFLVRGTGTVCFPIADGPAYSASWGPGSWKLISAPPPPPLDPALQVVFDEKTLEELQREKEQEPPKRKVDEHNTPYHDTYHHLSSSDEDLLGKEQKKSPLPSPKEGSHLHFLFNVQFNFTKPRVKSKMFRQKTKELIMEEGEMFKLMVKVPCVTTFEIRLRGGGGARDLSVCSADT